MAQFSGSNYLNYLSVHALPGLLCPVLQDLLHVETDGDETDLILGHFPGLVLERRLRTDTVAGKTMGQDLEEEEEDLAVVEDAEAPHHAELAGAPVDCPALGPPSAELVA